MIAELKRRNVAVIPTLARELSVFVYESTPAFFNDPFFLRGHRVYGQQMEQLKDPVRQEKTRNNPEAQAIKKALEQASRNRKLLSDAGVPIAVGTDTGANLMGRWQGYFEHVELELMVKAGLTPMQTLVSATGGAARALKLEGHLGTLQPGKSADFPRGEWSTTEKMALCRLPPRPAGRAGLASLPPTPCRRHRRLFSSFTDEWATTAFAPLVRFSSARAYPSIASREPSKKRRVPLGVISAARSIAVADFPATARPFELSRSALATSFAPSSRVTLTVHRGF